MKQSDPLELVAAGTLTRPGPVGRIVRFILGVLCVYVFGEIFYYWEWTTTQPFSTLDNRFLVLLAPLCVFNYVVNIGFTRSWGQRPLLLSIIVLVAAGGTAFLVAGTFNHPIVGVPLNLWLAYFYGHLGLSFLVASFLRTPGCEMRALPELIGKATGRASDEHHCPAGFITQVDAWEQRNLSG